jgi:hypothetical protein
MQVTRIRDEESMLLAGWHNVLIGRWSGASSVAQMEQVGEAHRAFRTRFPEGYNFFMILDATRGLGRPDEAVMEVGARVKREADPHILANPVVIEQGGLRGAFIRSIVTGVNMMSRSDVPNKVFDTFEAAVEWMGQVPRQDARLKQNAAELVTTLRSL